ncbi:Myb-like DNA-binding domain containing protein [Trichomonas vaginalis G3]|uniref:Myb-like DNA-binding domain containing protein n=1 Tax=Trichomonas vaginalis (strain ATCC PRA-98 / G3) TaxID=412133 RepID=A2G7Z3_TRIV3|nr:Myb-like DNA-binding domain containing protein [Trichomonas vaginalis G3]|eukprot:XP_001299655.1 Myb-like DNA-binding domain containing protein [Trichomonas vaginalis G3]
MNANFIYPMQYTYFSQKPPRKMFSPHEDVIIVTLANQQEKKDWKYIASHLPGRTPRQVRERFRNHLSPGLENGPWTREEDDLLRKLFKEYGSKWSLISSYFKSRSDTNVKNRWNSIAKMSSKMNSLKKTDASSIKNVSVKQSQE